MQISILGTPLGIIQVPEAYANTSVFSTNFNTGVPPEFSGSTDTEGVQGYLDLGSGTNKFDGDFLRNASGSPGVPQTPTTLMLTGLSPHTSVNISFLFAAIDSWDGIDGCVSPDRFNVKVDETLIFSKHFENSGCGTQDYFPPDGVELVRHVQLGFGLGDAFGDSAYNMGLDADTFQNIPHTSSTLTIMWFADGAGWQGGGDESWAIDNVEVNVNGNQSACGFQGLYDPANWTLTNTNADGLVDTFGAPASISMTGGNNDSGGEGSTDYTTNAHSNGNVSFDWDYESLDRDGPFFDPAGYLVNGVFNQLTVSGGTPTQSGSVTFPVVAGDVFGFRIITVDNFLGPGVYTSISNFGVDCVMPIPRSNGGNSFDVISPTINKINYYTVKDGTQTGGAGGILANFNNNLPIQIMKTGEVQRLQISVSDNNGNAAITRVVVNMNFDSVETKKGDTYFMYSEKDGLTVSDPLGLFTDVKAHRTFTDTEMILIFEFIPQMPTPPISFAFNGLDIYGNNQNTNIPDAAQVVGEPNPNTNNLIIPDSAEIVIPYYKMPYYEIPNADSEGNLIYYNSFGGLEENQVHPHYDPIIYPDDIGRAERHDDGFYDKVSAEEDKAKEVASAIMAHPIYSGEQKIFKTDKAFKYPSTVGKADRSNVDAMKELMLIENVKATHISKRTS